MAMTQTSAESAIRAIEHMTLAPEVAREASVTFDPAIDGYQVRRGNKLLEVMFDLEAAEITTLITKPLGTRPEAGSTTVVYDAAKCVMQTASDALGSPLEYKFCTGNPRMQAWAKQYGSQIFRWQVEAYSDPRYFVATRVFTPTTNSQ